MKKTLIVTLLVFAFNTAVAYCEIKTLHAESTCKMADSDTKAEAKAKCNEIARRKLLKQAVGHFRVNYKNIVPDDYELLSYLILILEIEDAKTTMMVQDQNIAIKSTVECTFDDVNIRDKISEIINGKNNSLKHRAIQIQIREMQRKIDALTANLSDEPQKILSSEIFAYQQEISYHVKKNWVFSDVLAGDRKDLECRIMIKINKDGTITDLYYEQRSGNRHLDESARLAILKSDPLPPLPKGYQLYNVGLIFTPSGLQ